MRSILYTVVCAFIGAPFAGGTNTMDAMDTIEGAEAANAPAPTGRGTGVPPVEHGQDAHATPEAKAAVKQFMEGPSVFIQNAGQWADDTVRFALDGAGANVGLTDNGPRFQLFRQMPASSTSSTPSIPPTPSNERGIPAASTESEMREFAVTFAGAACVAPTGRGTSDRTFNYLRGDVATHREGVPSFETVWYENLYPGVDLEVQGRRTGIKYNFHLAPGADWRAIRVQYDGIEGLSLRPDGALEIRIANDWQALADAAPYIYQEVDGEKREVAGRFRVIDEDAYGFEVTGEYDAALPLVIDPVVAWGSYLGGTNGDSGWGIAVDDSDNVYVTGQTTSAGWVSGGWDTILDVADGYVVKLSSTGTHVWSTFLGGAVYDPGRGIAVDAGGNVYVTGRTYSIGWVSGGWDTSKNSDYDGYLVKLNTAGAHVWSTYLGGTGPGDDYGYGVAVDGNGNVYTTGETYTSGWVSGGWDTILGGVVDGYIVKFSPAGAHLWSTYLGGTGADYGHGIAADSAGNIYATGYCDSLGWVAGGWDTGLDGSADGYLVKLSSSGAHVWSTYLGGSGDDRAHAVAVDGSDNVIVTGETSSFGWVTGGWDTILNGTSDGFVVKLSVAGAHVWSTYVGGTLEDYGWGIAAQRTGMIYVAGYTGVNSAYDGFVTKLTSDGLYAWSTYIGGIGNDDCRGIAVDGANNVCVTGTVPIASGWVSGGWDTSFGGGGADGFVASISQVLDLPAPPSNPGIIALSTSSIAWGWQDNSDNETGFNVYENPGADPPFTLQITTAPDVTSWFHVGLSPNTRYAFQVAAANANGDSVASPNFTAYTGIEPVSGLVFSSVGANSIGLASSNVPSNLTSGSSGLYFVSNAAPGSNSGWQQNNTPWTSTSLLPNTPYTFAGISRNGDGVQTTQSAPAIKYTLAATPLAPVVTVPGAHMTAVNALDVAIGQGDGNPGTTPYAIAISPAVGGNTWVQTSGTVGAAAVFQTAAAWDAKRVTGLATATTYTFSAIARNGENINTAVGPGASTATEGNSAPGAPGISFPTVQSDNANLTCAVVFTSSDPDGDQVTYAYDWHVKRQGETGFSPFDDGEPLSESVLSSQVNNTDTLPGDTWYVEVTPYDFDGAGTSAVTNECGIVIGGVVPSFISLSMVPTTITLGQFVVATGQIFPTTVSGATVNFESVSPGGPALPGVPDGVVVPGNSYAKLFYPAEASEGRSPWSISASWTGDVTYQAASSSPVTFVVLKAQPSLLVDLSASSAPVGFADLTATVDMTASLPGALSGLIEDQLVLLHARRPNGSFLGPAMALTDANGVATFDPAEFAISGITFDGTFAPGTWQFLAEYAGDDNFLAATSVDYDEVDTPRLVIRDGAGYAVLAVGKLDGFGEGLAEHRKTMDLVYRSFLDRGFGPDDIYYLREGIAVPGPNIVVDDTSPTKAAIANAIQVWAKDRMNEAAGPLYVVMIDHGSPGRFFAYSSGILSDINRAITPIELDGYLNTMQSGLDLDAQDEDIVVVLGACYSGSFIPVVSGPNRTVITSASANQVSHRGPVDPVDGIRGGEAFVSQLFRNFAGGKSLKESFERASAQIVEFTISKSNAADPAAVRPQEPRLDDNGDGLGTVATGLSAVVGHDGASAHGLTLGFGANAGDSVSWITARQTVILGPTTPIGSLWARATQAPSLRHDAWIVVKTPDFAGAVPSATGTSGDVLLDELQGELDLDSIPSGNIDPIDGQYNWTSLGTLFDAPGTYQVFYFIKDADSGETSSHALTTVYRAVDSGDENAPPPAVDLLYPDDGAVTGVNAFLAWSASIDPNGDPVVYRVELSTNEAFSGDIIVRDDLPSTYTTMGGLEDTLTYYWRVIARDAFGAFLPADQYRSFTVDQGNVDAAGPLVVNVRKLGTSIKIADATVTLKQGTEVRASETTDSTGDVVLTVADVGT